MTVNQYGQNAWQPYARQDTFIPDQLIAGNLQLVTKTVTIAAGKAYKRGTVLGRTSDTHLYSLCVQTATDGTQTPTAILVDDVDATAGQVTAGVYLMGGFNQNRITFDDSWTVENLAEALRDKSIFLQDSITGPGV